MDSGPSPHRVGLERAIWPNYVQTATQLWHSLTLTQRALLAANKISRSGCQRGGQRFFEQRRPLWSHSPPAAPDETARQRRATPPIQHMVGSRKRASHRAPRPEPGPAPAVTPVNKKPRTARRHTVSGHAVRYAWLVAVSEFVPNSVPVIPDESAAKHANAG